MIERIIFTAIQNGVDEINADPYIIDTIFTEQHQLPAEEAEKIRGYWTDHNPEVHHGYARQDANFPGFFIILTGERESDHFLGDEPEQFLDDTAHPDYGKFLHGSIWRHQLSILVYAQHPDVCLYYYQLLKYFLVSQDHFLKECGILDLDYSGGDMAPDKAWLPSGLFLRRFTIDASTEYKQRVAGDGGGLAWKVAGIHVSKDGAVGEDVGGVKTLVTPISPEDLDDGA